MRLTLTYLTNTGERIFLHNLLMPAVHDIVRAQRHLSSADFRVRPQSRDYGDYELAFLKKHPIPMTSPGWREVG